MPLAIHIPHILERIGSLAGFAAVIGLGILSALYFSQARDLRRLREWAGRAPERAAEAAESVGRGQPVPPPVPGRVVAVPQRSPQAVQAAVPVGSAAATAPEAPEEGAAEPAQAGAGANGAPRAAADAGEGEAEKSGEEAGEGAGGDGGPPGEAEDKPAAEAASSEEGDGEGADREGGEGDGAREGDDGEEAAAAPKPGMPAPASAAAAGAAAGAAAAGAAPGAGASAPSPPPQRPPGSVLPPRTGAVQPVRRVPAGTAQSNPAIGQTSILGPAGGRRAGRNPVYVALAVIGVLVLGAGAAIGVPKLVNGGSSSSKQPKAHRHARTAKLAPVAPRDVTVAVLNGTTVLGLAAQVGDQVQNAGFNLGTISNAAQQQRANSVAMYSPGHQRDAALVSRKLGIAAVEPVDANSQGIAGNANVVVIVGRDQTH